MEGKLSFDCHSLCTDLEGFHQIINESDFSRHKYQPVIDKDSNYLEIYNSSEKLFSPDGVHNSCSDSHELHSQDSHSSNLFMKKTETASSDWLHMAKSMFRSRAVIA